MLFCFFSGRSLSAMASSQIIHNPDLREGHMLKGWFEHDGHSMDFHGYKNDGMGGGGGGEVYGWTLILSINMIKLRHIHHINIFVFLFYLWASF